MATTSQPLPAFYFGGDVTGSTFTDVHGETMPGQQFFVIKGKISTSTFTRVDYVIKDTATTSKEVQSNIIINNSSTTVNLLNGTLIENINFPITGISVLLLIVAIGLKISRKNIVIFKGIDAQKRILNETNRENRLE